LDSIPYLGNDDPQRLVNRFLAHYDVPAYVRRARAVQDAFDGLIEQCRRQRDEWLQATRIELGTLHALAGDWNRLLPSLADAGQISVLERLHGELNPQLRVPVSVTSSAAKLRATLRTLTQCLDSFNRRWRPFLEKLDLSKVNEMRAAYNRYYLLEKECALRSPRLARQGFRPLEPLTVADVLAVVPPLPVPRLKD
jgi:hypothetical protein